MILLGTTTVHGPTGAYSVGWFTLALINAGLAEGKGRGRLNWWLISLLLGPLATLYILVSTARFDGE